MQATCLIDHKWRYNENLFTSQSWGGLVLAPSADGLGGSAQARGSRLGSVDGLLRGVLLGYIFDWDWKKAESNARKHGVTFDEASTVFGDPLGLLMPDPDHSLNEERYLVLGMSNQQRLLVVAFAERPPRTRLISARRATPREWRRYENKS